MTTTTTTTTTTNNNNNNNNNNRTINGTINDHKRAYSYLSEVLHGQRLPLGELHEVLVQQHLRPATTSKSKKHIENNNNGTCQQDT